MVRISRNTCLHDDIGITAQTGIHEMVMDGAGRK